MFTKNSVSQSMIDAVQSVLAEDKKLLLEPKAEKKDIKKDVEVGEELKGDQHKLDKNRNGKLDSHDFKLLRMKKEGVLDAIKSGAKKVVKKVVDTVGHKDDDDLLKDLEKETGGKRPNAYNKPKAEVTDPAGNVVWTTDESLEEVSLDLAKRARDKAEHMVDMDYDDMRDRPYGYSEKQRSKFQRYIDRKEPRAKGDRDWDPPKQGVAEAAKWRADDKEGKTWRSPDRDDGDLSPSKIKIDRSGKDVDDSGDELTSRPGAWRGKADMAKRMTKKGVPTKSELAFQNNLKMRMRMKKKEGRLTGPKSQLPEEQGVAEGAPELLKQEMPLVRHIERELAQHGYEKGTPEYNEVFKHTISMYRKFGNVDAIKKGVAEELKGDQHKLDKNRNGKLDSHDFKLLRMKKEEVKDEYARKVDKYLKKKHAPDAPVKNEEVEELDELSKGTLGNYVKKASNNAVISRKIAGDFERMADKARKPGLKDAHRELSSQYQQKSWKRKDGIIKAVDRLTKEDIGAMQSVVGENKGKKTVRVDTLQGVTTSTDPEVKNANAHFSGKKATLKAEGKTPDTPVPFVTDSVSPTQREINKAVKPTFKKIKEMLGKTGTSE